MSNVLKPLYELCNLNMGQSPKSDSYNQTGDGIPFYQGNADFGEIFPKVRYWCNSPTKIAYEDDILISVRAPIGALNIATEECCIGRGLAALTAKDGISDRQYLFYALRSRVDELNSRGTGSTFKAISKTILGDIKLPAPPLNEQQKIAAILDKTSNLIAERKKQIANFDLLVKSRFVEMFGDPVTNPMGWGIKKLGSITKKIGSGATPSGGKESYIDCGISLVRSMNVYNGFFKYDELAHITEQQAKLLNNVTLQSGDVLLNITGASVARCCIVPDDVLPARVNQHVSIIRGKPNEVNQIFLNRVLISDNYQNKLLAVGESGGATRQAITKQQIENMFIPFPPLPLQTRFADFVRQTDKSKFEIQQGLEKLELQYNALMQQYFG